MNQRMKGMLSKLDKNNSYKNFCLPIEFSTLIKLSNNVSYRPCEEIQEQKKNYEKVLQLVYSTPQCPRSCSYLQYNGKANPIYGMNNSRMISVTYWFGNRNDVKTFKEYLIYGVTDVIGFVGGTLGLFIGFSFLDSVMGIVNMFKNISFWHNSQRAQAS